MNVILNLVDAPAKPGSKHEKEIYNECADLLSRMIQAGNLDVTQSQYLFLCTKFGAVSVNLIPKEEFQ